MLALTRKQIHEQPERWQILYAGVRVGLIQQRSGAPASSDQWEWHCGFIPASNDTAHLTESQRAMVAAKIANLDLGSNQHSEGASIEVASNLLGVGRASVTDDSIEDQ